MRRGLVYALLLAAALLMRGRSVELGKMKPVETLHVRLQEGQIILRTDTEDMGAGVTVEAAIQDLEATTAGRIFLDTTRFLVTGDDAVYCIEAVEPYLKGNVRLCMVEGNVDLKDAGRYLHAHPPGMMLKQWNKDAQLQKLEVRNGKMEIK